MSTSVVEVGPSVVRGLRPAPQNLAAAALECIDDDIAILDDAPVAVDSIWRELFRAVLPDRVGDVVLICPTWWPPSRVERVRDVLPSSKVTVRQRADVLSDGSPDDPTVVEIAREFVTVVRAGDVVAADPRSGEPRDIARSVACHVVAPTTVLVDAPKGVVGGAELACAIAEFLRAGGSTVRTVHPDAVLRIKPEHDSWPRAMPSPRRRRSAVLTAAVVSAALLCVGVVVGFDEPSDGAPVPMTLLVEGRVAMKVPALWAVQRITSGPGSARVQVTAPDNTTALLMTQARVGSGETLSSTSAMLRRALDGQEAGTFSRFNPDDRRADRPAATYRELRGGRQIDWAVFVDGISRIAVGCQSVPGGDDIVRYACDEAIRSAHSVV